MAITKNPALRVVFLGAGRGGGGASLIAQLVKNPRIMQETRV